MPLMMMMKVTSPPITNGNNSRSSRVMAGLVWVVKRELQRRRRFSRSFVRSLAQLEVVDGGAGTGWHHNDDDDAGEGR